MWSRKRKPESMHPFQCFNFPQSQISQINNCNSNTFTTTGVHFCPNVSAAGWLGFPLYSLLLSQWQQISIWDLVENRTWVSEWVQTFKIWWLVYAFLPLSHSYFCCMHACCSLSLARAMRASTTYESTIYLFQGHVENPASLWTGLINWHYLVVLFLLRMHF